MSIPYGELAALATAVCWTCSSLAFSAAGRRLGSLSLNLVRLVIAFAFVTLYCRLERGMWLPLDADAPTWGWLLVSGLVGFVLGDLCLFRAFVLIGPRIAMLVMALSPLITTFFSWLWLDERIGGLGALGMMLTLLGVGWVVLERRPEEGKTETSAPRGEFAKGAVLALLGAAGQAIGLVLSKLGMKGYDPFASTQIRIMAGMLGFSVLFTAVRWWGPTRESLRDRMGVGLAALGAFAGPFLGVSLSLLSIQHTETGVAATIMSTVPVLIIPAVVVLYREKVSSRAVLGAVVAVGGVALLWAR